VIGSSPHHVCFFLCWAEGVANEVTKVVGISAERHKRHIGVALPLAKVKVRKLQLLVSWDSQLKIEFQPKILEWEAGEASDQHLLC
jgi:hypothetical protein